LNPCLFFSLISNFSFCFFTFFFFVFVFLFDDEYECKNMAAPKVLNVNIGVLGHVDSGKTSLAKALSTTASTAAFDKSPQSQERGITLDLGFSALRTALPPQIDPASGYSELQITLVDCPGHASLIKTIMGGAQIIDLMMLVVDAGKGIQTQTAECMVLADILGREVVVVLNKIDIWGAEERPAKIDAMKARLAKAFAQTGLRTTAIVPVSARENLGLDALLHTLTALVRAPEKESPLASLNLNSNGNFLFAADHCFTVKGQGTVVTGTVLHGSVSVGQSVYFPELQLERKVKSMQMFKKPVSGAQQGDRVALCVTNMDAAAMERGLVCAPQSFVSRCVAAVAPVTKVRFHKRRIESGDKFHMTLGHATVVASVQLYAAADGRAVAELTDDDAPDSVLALIRFEHPIFVPALETRPLLIASRLETDVHANVCRLAFRGAVAQVFGAEEQVAQGVRIWREKRREGAVDRLLPAEQCVLVKGMFDKESDLSLCAGLRVTWGAFRGTFDAPFGKSGKFKARFPDIEDWAAVDNAEWAATPIVLVYRKYLVGTSSSSSGGTSSSSSSGKSRFVQV
jgi:selenocysteine-specific elongation factor